MLPRHFKTDADIRKHQINTLKIFNENVVEINEGEEYDIPFNSGGNALVLKVVLSKDFPKEKPLIKVIPTIVHHWVNADGEVVSAPGLLNFTIHSDLGRVAQVIIREFQRTLSPVGNTQSNVASPSIPINGEVKSSQVSYQTLKSFSPPQQNYAFPELVKFSRQELKFLEENLNRQDEFIGNLPLIREQNKKIDEIMSGIEEIAENNLSKRERLEELRRDVDTRIEEVTKLAFENERLHAVYQNLSDKYAPRNIQDQLRKAVSSADEESERIAESFLNGDIDVDKFVSDFIKMKTLCQTRKTKEEKLGQQLDRLEKAGF